MAWLCQLQLQLRNSSKEMTHMGRDANEFQKCTMTPIQASSIGFIFNSSRRTGVKSCPDWENSSALSDGKVVRICRSRPIVGSGKRCPYIRGLKSKSCSPKGGGNSDTNFQIATRHCRQPPESHSCIRCDCGKAACILISLRREIRTGFYRSRRKQLRVSPPTFPILG
jgi:hypothetical protein